MKKTLLALAAVAASSAAFAQSSVTLYGVLDASVESVRGDDTLTRVSSDNYASSRLGFKGTEDLGGGTKANFMLETALKTDTGAGGSTVNGTASFWSRQAWVALAGGFGELRLGRTDSLIGEIAGSVLGTQAYDESVIIGTRAGAGYRRLSNSITYNLPSMVPGLNIGLQYSTAGGTGRVDESGADDSGKSVGISARYTAGPVSAGIGYLNAKDETPDNGTDEKANATLVYAGYDFGAAKITAYYNGETKSAAKRLALYGAKVAVPFSPEFSLIVGAAQARNTEGNAAGNDNVQIVSLKGVYSLSKRTAAYALFTNVNNGSATAFNVGAAASDDRTTRGIAIGVRHSF